MNHNMLGEKKKSNFDDNLADYVNKIYDNMPDEVVEEKQDVFPTEIKIYRPKNHMRTFDQWVVYYGKRKENIALMSDYYSTFKQLREMIKKDEKKQKAEEFLAQLRRDAEWGCFLGGGLISHTEIKYKHPDPENWGSITQNYMDRKGIFCISTEQIRLPVMGDSQKNPTIKGEIYLNELLCAHSGIGFIQRLLQTNDSAEQIIEVFKFFGNTESDEKLKVFLPKYLPTNQKRYNCNTLIRINGGITELMLAVPIKTEVVNAWGVKNEQSNPGR